MLEKEIKTISDLKSKIIAEYERMCKALAVGQNFDYIHILNELCFLEMGSLTNNPQLILNFLLNE